MVSRTWPKPACLAYYKANMLGTLFHLTGQIKGRCEDQVWVCLADLVLGVKSLEIDLSRGNGLLPSGHALSQLDEFWRGFFSITTADMT